MYIPSDFRSLLLCESFVKNKKVLFNYSLCEYSYFPIFIQVLFANNNNKKIESRNYCIHPYQRSPYLPQNKLVNTVDDFFYGKEKKKKMKSNDDDNNIEILEHEEYFTMQKMNSAVVLQSPICVHVYLYDVNIKMKRRSCETPIIPIIASVLS